MDDGILHGECQSCGECPGCWYDQVMIMAEDRDRWRDMATQLFYDRVKGEALFREAVGGNW